MLKRLWKKIAGVSRKHVRTANSRLDYSTSKSKHIFVSRSDHELIASLERSGAPYFIVAADDVG